MTSPRKSRPDFAQALIHFTRPRKGVARHWEPDYEKNPEPEISAFEALKEIYIDGVIRGSTSKSGYIKGKNRAVCMSEVPLSGIRYFAGPEEKYEYYGVAISKKSGFGVGARPVIYLPDKEASWIPVEERWRHVRFEPPSIDHTWEREWRLKGDLDLNAVVGCYFFVYSHDEKKSLEALSTGLTTVRGIFCMKHLFDMM